MSYSAAQLIASLPAEMRGTLTTTGGESATVGRAGIAQEIAASQYGEDDRYTLSLWVNVDDFATPPTRHERVTFEGTSYFCLSIRTFPGSLRRLDLGGLYG